MSSALAARADTSNVEKEAFYGEVNKLKDYLVSRQSHWLSEKLAKLCRAYDADVAAFKAKLQKSLERADGLQAWFYLPSNSRRKETEALKKANAVLRADTTKLTSKENLERLGLQKEFKKEKGNTPLQKKTIDRLRGTILSFNTNVSFRSSEIEVLHYS